MRKTSLGEGSVVESTINSAYDTVAFVAANIEMLKEIADAVVFTEDILNNLIGGSGAGENITTSFGNVLAGVDAGNSIETGFGNTYIGYRAGYGANLAGGADSSCTIIGYEAGRYIDSPSSNVLIGMRAGRGNVNDALRGIGNTFVGTNSGYNCSSGADNTFIGLNAGNGNTSNPLTGSRNIALGRNALNGIISTGTRNVVIGGYAGDFITTGAGNVLIGESTGRLLNTGINNVIIGRNAGPTTNQSNKLYIDSIGATSDTPLIGGDFVSRIVDINGTLNAEGTVQLAAGTIVAGTAPLYFQDGPLLTIPEDGALEYNDGHLFFTHGDRFALVAANGVKVTTTTVVNTVVETEIFSHILPANSLHSDMRILFSATGAFDTDSAAESITVRMKIGALTVHTFVVTPANGTDIAWRGIHEGTIRTAGANGTFIDFTEFSESDVAPIFKAEATVHSIDTTIDNTYSVTIEWGAAKAGNSFSCTQGDLTYKH